MTIGLFFSTNIVKGLLGYTCDIINLLSTKPKSDLDVIADITVGLYGFFFLRYESNILGTKFSLYPIIAKYSIKFGESAIYGIFFIKSSPSPDIYQNLISLTYNNRIN